MTRPPLYSLAPLTSPCLSVSALLLTPLSFFSSPRTASPGWLASSAASNSRLLAANLEGICSPIKVHVQYDFHPFPLTLFFFSSPSRSPPAYSVPRLSPCINKDPNRNSQILWKTKNTPLLNSRRNQQGEYKHSVSFQVQLSLQQRSLCSVMGRNETWKCSFSCLFLTT